MGIRKILFFIAITATACSPAYDPSSIDGKYAIMDQAKHELDLENCTGALDVLLPLYESNFTDNEVRMLWSSANACNARLNFFAFTQALQNNSLVGTAFWKTMAKLSYSNLTDQKTEATWAATDAAMAALGPGKLPSSANKITSDPYNTGSVLVTDRTDDANLYLVILSMVTMGTLQNRYSQPNGSYAKTHVLGYTAARTGGWEVADNMTESGCSFAAAALNMVDSAGQVSTSVSGTLGQALGALNLQFKAAFDDACDQGCQGAGGYNVTGCSFAAGACTPCPITLRSRSVCKTNSTGHTQLEACAAAGIAHFINSDGSLGWN